MAMFGSSWLEDSKDVGPMSHWKEEVEIPAVDVNYEACRRLRKETGMGLMACKKCLIDYDWNFEEALKHYRSYAWDGRL